MSLLKLTGVLLSGWYKFGVNGIVTTAETCPPAIQALPFGSTLLTHAPSTWAVWWLRLWLTSFRAGSQHRLARREREQAALGHARTHAGKQKHVRGVSYSGDKLIFPVCCHLPRPPSDHSGIWQICDSGPSVASQVCARFPLLVSLPVCEGPWRELSSCNFVAQDSPPPPPFWGRI